MVVRVVESLECRTTNVLAFRWSMFGPDCARNEGVDQSTKQQKERGLMSDLGQIP